MSEILFFSDQNADLCLTEFGYSAPTEPREVGPWVRNTYILHYVVKDVCYFDGFRAQAGEAFLIAKDTLHHFTVQPGYVHFWFAFDGYAITDWLSAHNIPFRQHTLFSVAHPPLAETILKAAFQSCREPHMDTAAIAKSALFFLLPLLSPKIQHRTAGTDAVRTAATFIEQHYARHITIQQIAATVFLSEKYLCKKFREEMGMPPQQYLMQVRMQRAMRLLQQSNLQIQEIARSVGYDSPLAFSAAFKSFADISPSGYRESVQKPSD